MRASASLSANRSALLKTTPTLGPPVQLPEWELEPKTSCDKNGSPEIRTQDQSVKSRVLYR
jgi:hypothetical protein